MQIEKKFILRIKLKVRMRIMSDNPTNSLHDLAEAASTLRACRPLADRLVLRGVIVELSEQEQAQLLGFELLVLADYSDSEWSYLRLASGVKVSGVAALNSCLSHFRPKAPIRLYGPL
jgi:hypothetical protein